MPEEESEDQSDTESHKPRNEHERCAFDVGEMAQDRHPFGDLASCLGEYFALSNNSINYLKHFSVKYVSYFA